MKKSFMTRALAMGLSFAMAFSLSAATNVTTASAAAKKASVTSMMKVSSKTVTEGKKVTTYMNSTAAKKYRIKSHTESSVTKKYISVKMTDSRKGLTITAKEGALAAANLEKKGVYVKINFAPAKSVAAVKKAAATKYVKLKVAVVAAEKPVEPEQPVEEALALTEVKQTASNAVNVTFNKDASKDVTKDNLTVKSVDGSVQLSVKDVVFSADGLSAKVTVFGNFADGTQYNVNYDSVDQTFTASVGAVASIVVSTTQAQENVTTPIEFSLFDATGIDVTPAISLDTKVYVSVTGTYSSVDVSKASSAKITMTNVGDTAEVTVTYNSNDKDSVDVVGKQTITCVDAKAAQGNKLFAVTTDTNTESGCAKFYQGLSDTVAKIALDATSDIYFCAKDENGDVIKYDSYEVESSNDNIANAVVQNGDGKFAKIAATANSIGSAQLNITASKNGKESYYTIPVTTYKADVPVKMTLTIDKSVMSDADDDAYHATVKAQLLDAEGNAVKSDFTAKITDEIGNNVTPIVLGSTAENGKTEASFTVTAKNATARTYTIEVTGADNNDYTTPFTRRVNVTVKALPEVLKNITYNIELSKSTLDVSKSGERATTAKLYATCNGLFAGYVDMATMNEDTAAGTLATIGGRDVTTGEAIEAVSMSAIFGTQVFGEDGTLVTTSAIVGITSGGACTNASTDWQIDGDGATATHAAITFTTVDEGDKEIDTNGEVAKLGNYTIKFQYVKTAANAKVESRTTNVAVKNSYKTPTVKVLSTKVNNVTDTDIITDCLTTNVDMNNDVSEHQSILGLYDTKYNKIVGPNNAPANNKIIAKYAQVKDNIGDETWLFYVPINSTFSQK